MRWLRPALALLVIAVVYLYRLDRPLLWGDEAETGIVGRNILSQGRPTAFDGRNATLFNNGFSLNRGLVMKRNPWFSYYVAAASLAIFGNNTAGLRVLFALTGVLAFFPLYAVLKPRLRCPELIALLILIAPQTVFFQRNARYYPIAILLYALLLWHLSADFKSRKAQCAGAALIFILFFQTNHFVAANCALSLLVFCLFFRRKSLWIYTLSSGIGFLSWLAWYESLGPSLVQTGLSISLITVEFGYWLNRFFEGLAATVLDLDAVGYFPILLGVVLALLLLKYRANFLKVFKDALPQFILLTMVVQTVATSVLLGCEGNQKYSFLRYMCYAAVFLMVPCFMLLNSLIRNQSVYILACLLVAGTNLFSLGFWEKIAARNVPVSWFPPVYAEIFRPRENAWDTVIAQMRAKSDNESSRNTPVLFLPGWTEEVAIFYLGDRWLITPRLDEPDPESVQSVRNIMGEPAFNRLFGQPEWIVDFLHVVKTAPAGYELAAVIPSYQTRPDDGSRPELNRHSFPQSAVVGDVKLFHLQKN